VSVKPRIEEETGEVRPESVAVIAAVQAYKYVEYSIPLIAPIVRKVSAIFVKK